MRSKVAQRRRRPVSAASMAPPILEFDQSGKLLRSWGGKDGPGYQWPDSNHGLNIDNKGNVWIGGNGGQDGHILKFTQDGKFVMQVGKKGVTPDSMATGSLLHGGRDLLPRAGERGLRRRMAMATGASR